MGGWDPPVPFVLTQGKEVKGLSSQAPSRAAQAFLWPLQTLVSTCVPHNGLRSVLHGGLARVTGQ